MAGKKSKKAKKNARQKERKANCKENVRRMDRIEAIMEDDGSVEESYEEGNEPSVAVVPPTSARIAYCKQMGDPNFRQLEDQEMMADILHWRNSILCRYRGDGVMYPFVSRGFEWDLSKKNSNLLREHEGSEAKRSAAEMARDLSSFLRIIAYLVPDALRLWVLEKSNSFEGIMIMIRDFYGYKAKETVIKRDLLEDVVNSNVLDGSNDKE